MKRTRFWLRLCTVLLVLNLMFIWGNSVMPRKTSASISKGVEEMLHSDADETSTKPKIGHGQLRKIAHFLEFASLGFLFAWLYAMVKKPVLLAFPCGVAAACVDEFIQCIVPNRGPSIKDVLIDTAGVFAGVAMICLILFVLKHYKKEKTQ